MSERSDLLASIADTIGDYRAGEIAQPTPQHVDRWIRQFGEDVQVPLLHEIDHVLKETYFSRERVSVFLQHLVSNKKLSGSNPCNFWRKARFLRIQQHGHSQAELLVIFDRALESDCGFKTAACGAVGGDFVYLDDAMFSGNRCGCKDPWCLQQPEGNHAPPRFQSLRSGFWLDDRDVPQLPEQLPTRALVGRSGSFSRATP